MIPGLRPVIVGAFDPEALIIGAAGFRLLALFPPDRGFVADLDAYSFGEGAPEVVKKSADC